MSNGDHSDDDCNALLLFAPESRPRIAPERDTVTPAAAAATLAADRLGTSDPPAGLPRRRAAARRRGLWLFVFAVAALGLAPVGLWLRGGRSSTGGVPVVESIPDNPPSERAATVADTFSPITTGDESPAPTNVMVATRPSVSPPAVAVSMPPTGSTGTTLRRETMRYGGVLHVKSVPSGANVFLNERVAGQTPLTLTGVPIGSRAVRVELQGYRPWSQAVRIVADETAALTAELTPVEH